VRDVAKMIHRDHTMSNGKLEQIVEDKPSHAPSKDGLRAMETPKQGAATADAADFDRAYIQEQIQAHKESIALFRKQSAEGSDPELRRFAEEMRTGTDDARRVAEDLGGIIGEMQSSFTSFSEVQQGMASQAVGVAQIEEAVVQVAAGARQTAVSVGEFTRVADELAHAVAVLEDAAARFTLRAQAADDADGAGKG
jgi:hypothetical protein